LKARITTLAPANEGVQFLGFRLYRGTVLMPAATRKRLYRRIKGRVRALEEGRSAPETVWNGLEAMFVHAARADSLEWRQEVVRRLGL